MAKTSRKLGVPLPPRGYWAKMKVGKAPKRPPLPARTAEEPDRLASCRRARPPQSPPPPGLDAAIAVPVESPIVVCNVLADPHPLVERTMKYLTDASPAFDGLIRWTNKPCLDINVSTEALDRALCIADALLKALEAAGLRVEERIVQRRGKRPPRRSIWEPLQPGEPEVRVTRLLCDDEWMHFAITEKVKRSKDPKPDPPPRKLGWDGTYYDEYVPTTYSYEPTGRLSLDITNVERLPVKTTWNDGKRQHLETCLTEFVTNLGRVALAMRLQREEDERQRMAAIEEEERRRVAELEESRRRWARQQHERAEEEREKRLLTKLDRWRLARDIREYVKDTAELFNQYKGVAEMDPSLRWELAWALRHARSLDPRTPLEKELQKIKTDAAARDDGDLEPPSC